MRVRRPQSLGEPEATRQDSELRERLARLQDLAADGRNPTCAVRLNVNVAVVLALIVPVAIVCAVVRHILAGDAPQLLFSGMLGAVACFVVGGVMVRHDRSKRRVLLLVALDIALIDAAFLLLFYAYGLVP